MIALLLLKTLLVFAAAGLTLFALRRASAAARHLVCLLTLAALLALPLFSLALPGWQMLPGFASPVGALLAAPSGSLSPNPTSDFSSPTHRSVSAPKSKPELAVTREGASGKEGAPGKEGAASSAPTILLLCVYAGGILIALTRPLLGLWGIRQLSRACVPFTDAPALSLAADCAAVLHLTRRLELRQAAVSVPMTWGSRRPVVLLPLGAEKWPEDRLRAVLLHELAHVRRSDWLGHRFADIVCALYWFHPLAWLTARRLRAESEAACDDMVLASGMAAPDYARHLLEIARALPPVGTGPQTAIAMAPTSGVEKRLRMILDETCDRRTLPRRLLIAALGLSLVSLVSLSVMRPAVRAQEISLASPRTVPASVANDVKIAGIIENEIVGGRKLEQTKSRWWDQSGLRLSAPLFDPSETLDKMGPIPNQRFLSIAFRLPVASRAATFTYDLGTVEFSLSKSLRSGKIKGQANWTEGQLNPNTDGTRVITARFPATFTRANLRVGVANGTWSTMYSDTGQGQSISNPSEPGGRTTFISNPMIETRSGLVITVTTGGVKDDVRIVAVDRKNQILLPESLDENSGGGISQITGHFALPLKQLKEFRIQTRPFAWTEFKNVALQPVK